MKKETILIVEDNEMLREGMCEMLSGEDFEVLSACNGLEALEVMKNSTPDLILSDINMPEMDGFAFFNAVRTRAEWVPIPLIFLTARSEVSDVLTGRNLGAEDYLTKPISRDELVTTIRSRLKRSHQVQVAQLHQAYQASLTALANAIEERAPHSESHVERLTECTLLLGDYLGWHQRNLEQLRFGAILHDLGKIHIAEEILLKSAPLTDQEWEAIRRHPITGAMMVKDVPHLAGAVPIVRHHHERWDGKGYPDGLSGKAIPEGARILAVADAFDTMTSERPYAPARSLEDAYEEILALAGENYDPTVVIAFQRAWQDGKITRLYE